jgi:hypothetical protein
MPLIEETSLSRHSSKSWPGETMAGCDTNRWIPQSGNSMASVGKSTAIIFSSGKS